MKLNGVGAFFFVKKHVSGYLWTLLEQRLVGFRIGLGSFCRIGPAGIGLDMSCRIGSAEPVDSKTVAPNK